LPPYEETGKQTMMVDHNTGKIITGDAYIAQRKSDALAGVIFNPQLDFVPIKQLGRKYPYDPDYSNWSPRVSVAWNPSYSSGLFGDLLGNRKTVIRAGYAKVYDRINGVGIVMIPALGVGFGNNLRCKGPRNPATTASEGVECHSNADPSNSFRIGTDGTVIPMPKLASIPSGDPLVPGDNSPFETLDFRIDPKRKVGYAHTFDLTIQRQLPGNMMLEVGYVGNYAKRLYNGYALSAVPYMYTLGGQSFPVQNSGGADNTQVYDSYMIGSHGRSNYNAGFLSVRKSSASGLTFAFNYTFSHAFDQIGNNQENLNESSDAFNLDRDYGSAVFDRRHTFTTLVTYDLPFGSGKRHSSGSGAVNKVIGGWNIAGVWVYGSGLPIDVYNSTSNEEIGQGAVFGNNAGYISIGNKYYNASPSNGSTNAFPDSEAVRLNFRPPDLFLDGRNGRGFIRSYGRWNVDLGFSKTTKITERVSTRFDCQMSNVFNHPQLLGTGGFYSGDMALNFNTPAASAPSIANTTVRDSSSSVCASISKHSQSDSLSGVEPQCSTPFSFRTLRLPRK
jgi:hypothetical protein